MVGAARFKTRRNLIVQKTAFAVCITLGGEECTRGHGCCVWSVLLHLTLAHVYICVSIYACTYICVLILLLYFVYVPPSIYLSTGEAQGCEGQGGEEGREQRRRQFFRGVFGRGGQSLRFYLDTRTRRWKKYVYLYLGCILYAGGESEASCVQVMRNDK